MTQTFEFSKAKSSVQDLLNKYGKTASAEDIEALEEEGYGDDEDDEDDEDAVDEDDQAGDSTGNSTVNKGRMKEGTRTLWHRYNKGLNYNKGLKLPEDQPIPVKHNISVACKDQYGKGDGAPAFGVVIVFEAHCLRKKRSFAHQFGRLTDRLAFCPVTASPTLNGIKDLRGLASLKRKTTSLDRVMRVPESHTAEGYLLAPEIKPVGDTEYPFKDKDGQEHTKKLPSLFTPNFTKTEEFQGLKTWWEADKSRRQIYLLLDPFLNVLTQQGTSTDKVVQGLNNTIITRRQMPTLLTVTKELSGIDEDDKTFPGADIPPTKTVAVDVSHSADVQKEVPEVMDDLLDQLHQATGDDDSEDVISEESDYGEGGESAQDSIPKISMAVDRLVHLSSYDYNYKIIMDKGAQEWDPYNEPIRALVCGTSVGCGSKPVRLAG